MAEFFLPHHVHFCYRGDAAVFLDLRQDDYTFVGAETVAALRKLSSHYIGAEMPQLLAALKDLLDGGLLTTDCRAGRAVTPTTDAPASGPLLDEEVTRAVQVSAGHVWNFFAAATMAAARLRWGRLETTIARVQRRKAHAAPVDFDRARELVAVFERLRSLFPRPYLCLYDSLALIDFLARYGVFPSWMFGIRLEPWGAHCWVQEAGIIFNEGVEEAAGYTPVMLV
jgi:hypothetical protein